MGKFTRSAFICKLGLCLVLALAGCKRTPAPAPLVASEPEATVQQLARHLHDGDLEGWARAAVPASEYALLETAWAENRSRWPLTELPLDDQLQPLLATLAAADAERNLGQAFQRNFANQHRDIKQGAQSLGLFGVQYVGNEGVYSDEERVHYAQLITALAQWAQAAPLGDPKRGKAAITDLAVAARKTGLVTEQDFHAAGMTGTLRQLQPFLAQLKTTLNHYGLPLEQSFAGLHTELVEQQGDQAKVRIRYPLGTKQIETTLSLQRLQGHWYLEGNLRHAREALAPPPPETGEDTEIPPPTATPDAPPA